MTKSRRHIIWIVLLSGVILPALFFVGYVLWVNKQFEDSFKPFDETEFLKTHYQGVDCSSLVGTVRFGDYGISAQEACAGERAWYENNIEFCELYKFNPFPDACLTWMAVKTGDLKTCETNNKEWTYRCYEYVAKYRDDPKVCDLLPYVAESKQQCVEGATDGETYLQFNGSPIRPYCLRRDSNGTCTW